MYMLKTNELLRMFRSSFTCRSSTKKAIHRTKKCPILYSLSFRLSKRALLSGLNFFYPNVQFENESHVHFPLNWDANKALSNNNNSMVLCFCTKYFSECKFPTIHLFYSAAKPFKGYIH